MPKPSDLIADEDALWHELHDLVGRFSADEAVRPGYFDEGWSAKDALAHVGTWLAEAGVALEQMRGGTYTSAPAPGEIDELNRRFYEAMRDVPLGVVRAQAAAARARLLHAWAELLEVDERGDRPGSEPANSEEAVSWIRKAGPDHYREHLPRLRQWLEEVRAS